MNTSENPVVTIPQGILSGKVGVDYNGKEFYSFQGIPYARPPLGNLRFKPPQPPDKWTGVRDATREGSECYSRNLITNMMGGSEDCLFLNVYTPMKNKGQLLPVMFWIHGGGFVAGSGGTELYGPEYLIAENVILVTINYRVGPLGFLAFSNPSTGVTGNAGLKDIVMALKWVQKNIKYFSGDPKNVTISGESAGGAAVHFLILSPMAKGLFHKAILQSGSALNSFTRSNCSYTYQLAQNLGIDNNNDKFILNELQKVPVEELFNASKKVWDSFLISNTRPFCPVIEAKSKEPAFISEEPLAIIKSGKYNKVPIIMGYNTLEGVFVYSMMRASNENYFLCDKSLVPNTMNLRIDSDAFKKVAEEIKSFYNITGNESKENDEDLEKALKIYTHNFFMVDICRSAMLHLQNNKFPIYLYRFDMDTSLNFMKILSRVNIKGAAHADDLAYLFGNSLFSPPERNSLEDKTIRKMTKLWSNFAKNGNPTPSIDELIKTRWVPATTKHLNYLYMENSGFRMIANPDQDIVNFWENLYDKNQVILSKL